MWWAFFSAILGTPSHAIITVINLVLFKKEHFYEYWVSCAHSFHVSSKKQQCFDWLLDAQWHTPHKCQLLIQRRRCVMWQCRNSSLCIICPTYPCTPNLAGLYEVFVKVLYILPTMIVFNGILNNSFPFIWLNKRWVMIAVLI